MNRRLFLALFSLLVAPAVCGLLPGCRKNKPALPPERARTGARAAYAHTRKILSYGPRPTESAALRNTRAYITDQLEQHGWTVTPQPFTRRVAPLGKQLRFINLIARFGATTEDQIDGLLGAHIDSKFYPGRRFAGADDAASAVGVILELARQLRNEPEKASRIELVFFDGEEAFGQNISPSDGLYGSKHYAQHWRTAARSPSFGIILDMVGHKDLKIRYPSDTPSFLEDALLDAARKTSSLERFTRSLNPIMDDHVALNNAGIPTIDIIGDFSQGGWWHTERDNLRRISRDSLEITLAVTSEMLSTLLRK